MQTLREIVLAKVHQTPELVIDGFFTSPRADYRWLSNYHPCEIEFFGYKFKDTETAYHAFKTFVEEEKKALSETATPMAAKKMGQTVLMRPDWESVKEECMNQVLRQKFKPGSELAERLKATYPADLIETNWWHDRQWGVCVCEKCGNKGLNMLGKLLEKIRLELVEAK